MATRKRGAKRMQAWIELRADDPEALSTLDVARANLSAGRDLESLRRMRVFELSGKLPGRDEAAELLHRSTQFYNPHKERCTVRTDVTETPPLAPMEWLIFVFERGGERRAAAERWWHHETGQRIEVREGTAWALRFAVPPEAAGAVRDLAELRDRAHGLLCNPNSQECIVARDEIPLPLWAGLRAAAPNPNPEGDAA